MGMQKMGLILAIALLSLNLKAQHTVGSGGDYIRQIFEQGRTKAAAKLASLTTCSFDSNVPPEMKAWILGNKDLIKADIEKSNHLWVVDAQPTCAFTIHAPQSSIYLSYPTCDTKNADADTAMFTLIHESAHHLGISDEQQADIVATLITQAVFVEKCAADLSVFDSMICQGNPATAQDIGKLFKPGAVSAVVGKYGFYVRSRLCSTLSGCGDWQNNQLVQGNKYNYTSVSFSPSAVLGVNLQATFSAQVDFPYYKVNFCKSTNFSCESMQSKVQIEVNGTENTYNNTLLIYDLLKGRPYPAFSSAGGDQFGNVTAVPKFYFEATGKTAARCSWYQQNTIDNLGDGFTQYNEFVLYGTH
jgi:hypothetical protein